MRVKLGQSDRIEIPSTVLLFSDIAPQQSLTIYNRGEQEAQVRVYAPDGFHVGVSASETIAEAATLILPRLGAGVLFVKSLRGAGADSLLSVVSPTKTLQVVLRHVIGRSRAGFQPKYIVGIDFGTRNTSLYLRDVKANTVEPVAQSERFPSLLYIDPKVPDSARIGYAALKARKDISSPLDAIYVESIKTLVRLEHEPYTDLFGVKWTVAKLLQRYLSELQKLIAKRLKSLEIWDDGNIVYVFTLPVLDGGTVYEVLKQRMFAAAIRSGFPDDPVLTRFIPEPHAAALQIVHMLPELAAIGLWQTGLQPGAKICVVDAGGGTTDVCIGELLLDNSGRWSFKTESTLALSNKPNQALLFFTSLLYPSASPRRYMRVDNQVGGNVLDQMVADQSIANFHDNTHFVANPWNELYPQYASPELQPVAVEKFLDGIRRLKEELCMSPQNEINILAKEFGDFDYNVRFDSSATLDNAFGEGGVNCQPIFSYSQDVVPAVQIMWSDPEVGAKLKSAVDAVGGCDFVVPIGGTTLIPEFTKQIEAWSGAKLIPLPGLDRVTAVAIGAVWAFDTRLTHMLPMGLQFIIHTEDTPFSAGVVLGESVLVRPYQPVTGIVRFDRTYRVEGSSAVLVDLCSAMDDQPKPLALASWRYNGNIPADITIIAEVADDNVITVSVGHEDTTPELLWSVRI